MSQPPPINAEALLAELSGEAATLARSVLSRVRELGTVSERVARGEIAFAATTAGPTERARLLLRPGALPRLVFPPEQARPPIDVTGLASAAAAAEAIGSAATVATAQAPQLDFFGKRQP